MADASSNAWRVAPLPLVATALIAVLVAATGGLWAYYGTTVFFEIVRTGWMACF